MSKKRTPRPAKSEPAAATQPYAYSSEFRGVRSLHLMSPNYPELDFAPIQGSMRLSQPERLELEYVQQMNLWLLFKPQPAHIVQLGLGAASLTNFCYQHFPAAKVTAVDINPWVISLCHSEFYLPADDERLSVLEMDAWDYVQSPKLAGKLDILQVDLYDAEAQKPALDSLEFYQACANCLNPDGMLTVNLFSNAQQRQRNIARLQECFDAVVWLAEVHQHNLIALAFKKAPVIDFTQLQHRATEISQKYHLDTDNWIQGLYQWMAQSD